MHAMPIERTIEEAAEVIRSGGIVAYPTEAVWGLGCDPFDEGAVHRLLAIKQRPVEKGLILIAATLEQLKPLIDVAAVLARAAFGPKGSTHAQPDRRVSPDHGPDANVVAPALGTSSGHRSVAAHEARFARSRR